VSGYRPLAKKRKSASDEADSGPQGRRQKEPKPRSHWTCLGGWHLLVSPSHSQQLFQLLHVRLARHSQKDNSGGYDLHRDRLIRSRRDWALATARRAWHAIRPICFPVPPLHRLSLPAVFGLPSDRSCFGISVPQLSPDSDGVDKLWVVASRNLLENAEFQARKMLIDSPRYEIGQLSRFLWSVTIILPFSDQI
jgi:hypothetical protein